MKVLVNDSDKPVESKYPRLMTNKSVGSVWLITAPKHGTLLIKGISSYSVGESYYKLMTECYVDFNGSITISNS